MTTTNRSTKTTHTPGPWRACQEGKCSCMIVWSTTADHPVCKVESGEWGDSYPAIRFAEGEGQGSIGARVEPYMEMLGYGSIDMEVARMNAHLIAAAPELLMALKRLLPMARACKHETFSNLDGKEDTRTAALKNALQAIAKAEAPHA